LDLKQCQVGSREQEVVLQTLAQAAARPGCRFLEVGSWCGDSTLLLGRIAQKFGGHVFCVDWWKGTPGTGLADIAAAEDVFAAFWLRMKKEGLEETIVPIRGPSALVAQVLAAGAFDLAFIDADHAYAGIAQDIRLYAPLVRRDGGILCGHDCEGRIADYDPEFLEAGKQVDYYESVHCGVVLAVGLAFPYAAVDHAIWSVRALQDGSWEPTNLVFPGIKHHRQPLAPPIAHSRSFNLFRYGRLVYAVPNLLGSSDLAQALDTNFTAFASARNAHELETPIGETVFVGAPPRLVDSYQTFNIIEYRERLIALGQWVGPVQLSDLDECDIQALQARGGCVVAGSIKELKSAIDRLSEPAGVESRPQTQNVDEPATVTRDAAAIGVQVSRNEGGHDLPATDPAPGTHIVHLMASPFIGGPERQVLGLARHLPPRFRTTFLSFSEQGGARMFLHEARRLGFDSVELRNNAPYYARCVNEIAEELRQRRASVLCCSGYKPDLIGWRAARQAGIPVVAIAHGWTAATTKVRVYEAFDRIVMRWMDAVVCVSRAQADRVRRALVPERKLVLILNAIGAEAFTSPEPRYRYELMQLFPEPPRLIVGAAGRLSPEKNFALFADAAALVAVQRRDVGFVVFGEGPLRSALTHQIARLGLGERFVLAGFRGDAFKYLPHIDLAVMSSTTEGLPVFMLEAFAAGLPMVATAVGGIPEVLEEGRSGYLVPSRDAAAMARRILDALGDDNARRTMGRHARELVRRDFSFEKQAEQYARLFARLVETTHAANIG
jgi:glycosyltransferase involved in cell wall biosynthesis/predicted O-methyltransferase YrrM